MLPDGIFMAATGAFLHFTLIQNDLISFRSPAATFLAREVTESERETIRDESGREAQCEKCL